MSNPAIFNVTENVRKHRKHERIYPTFFPINVLLKSIVVDLETRGFISLVRMVMVNLLKEIG
jgi:hypothetical protein